MDMNTPPLTQEDPLVNGELAITRNGFSLSLGLTSTAGS